MEGIVRSGKGDGKYYIGMDVYQEAFHEILGYHPFAGTLNLEVDPRERKELEKESEPYIIENVYHEGERVSDVEVHPCKIEGIECAALKLEKTDHPDSILEIVAEENLRDVLGLDDGDKVEIEKA